MNRNNKAKIADLRRKVARARIVGDKDTVLGLRFYASAQMSNWADQEMRDWETLQ